MEPTLIGSILMFVADTDTDTEFEFEWQIIPNLVSTLSPPAAEWQQHRGSRRIASRTQGMFFSIFMAYLYIHVYILLMII
jgi:hypothetical protein